MTRWQVLDEMGVTSDLSPIKELIQARGYEVDQFLTPSIDDLHDPFLMKGMTEGVDEILKAIHAKQTIYIAGDYDAKL